MIIFFFFIHIISLKYYHLKLYLYFAVMDLNKSTCPIIKDVHQNKKWKFKNFRNFYFDDN